MSDNVVRDRVALALWRFACPPKLLDELAGSPPEVFVRMADAVVAELAAIQAESVVDSVVGAAVGVVAKAALGVAADGGMNQSSPSEGSLRAAGMFMAAMEAEEHARRLSLPPVGSAVEWARASDGDGGAPIDLVVVEGPSAGVRVALDRPKLVIGRAADCDVRLADELVSPRHARLAWEPTRWPGGRWVVEDLGSVNGTFVGGTRAFTRLPVAVGVRVQVGGSVFELR